MARSPRKPSEGGKKKRKQKSQAELPTPSEMERAFVRDILDHPYEDARYRILADWLEEQGDPVSLDRAEIIRIQCELAHRSEEDPRHKELSEREEAVLARLEQTWLAPLKRCGVEVEARTLSRGMVSRIHAAGAEDLCKLDEQLFDAYPSLRGLSIITRIHVQEASGSPRGFVLVYPSLDVEKLTTAPCLARLREMSLIHCNLGPEGMRILASSSLVRNLNWLVIVDHQNKPGADHMAEDMPIADDGLAALAASPHFTELADLRLWYNRIGPRGAHALAHSPHLKSLKLLTLGHNPLGDEGARALAEGPSLAQLEELVLHHNDIGPEGAGALARSPFLSRLKNLTLGDQRLGRRGLDLLRERFGKALHADEESAREPD